MTKVEMIEKIAEKSGLSKANAKKALDAVTDVLSEGLVAGDRFQLNGFGTFSVRERPARKARNPRDGSEIELPAAKIVGYKMAKGLKEKLNG